MNNIHQEKLAAKFFKIYRDSIFFPIGHTGRFMDGIINKQRRGIFEITHLSFTLKNYAIKLSGMKHTKTYTLTQSTNLAMIYDLSVDLNGTQILSYEVHLLRDGKHVIIIKNATFGPWVAILTQPVPPSQVTTTPSAGVVNRAHSRPTSASSPASSNSLPRERPKLRLISSS